jgi:hypothetical protein
MAHNGRREAVALCLASGCTVRDAAREAGCGERTVHTWLTDPAFRNRVSQVRTELFGRAVGRLSRLAGRAADSLGELLEAQNESVRLQAAKTILEAGARLREALELAQRLDDVEARLGPEARPEEYQP